MKKLLKLKVLLIKQLLMTKLTKVIIMVIRLLLLFNLKQLKPEAKQAIDEVAKAKKDLIDQTPNATKKEKRCKENQK